MSDINNNKTTTLADIAEEAGVSKATVSLALNNNPKVAKKTAQKVLKIAKKRNYKPNKFARSLSTGKSNIISLFLLGETGGSTGWAVSSSWMFYNPMFQGLSVTLSRRNYQLQFEFIDTKRQDYKEIIQDALNDQSTGGILLYITSSKDDYSFLTEKRNNNLPIIILNKKVSPGIASIEFNDYIGAYDAVDYLINLGHKKIAHIRGPQDSFNAEERLNGYKQVLKENNLEIKQDYIVVGDWLIEKGEKRMDDLLKLDDPPTAVFCANDYVAAGAINTINKWNLEVPRDISIIGFDNSEIAKVVSPKLTTVEFPLINLGRIAAKEIVDYIEKTGKNMNQHSILTPKLIKRNSCTEVK